MKYKVMITKRRGIPVSLSFVSVSARDRDIIGGIGKGIGIGIGIGSLASVILVMQRMMDTVLGLV